MSEYQFYEFHAIDHPLSPGDREALRKLSSRARITATSFVNTYEWGDFKGDPADLMERWFDIHVYLANWASRRLMLRFPAKLVDKSRLESLVTGIDCATLWTAGENLILDIVRDELDIGDWDDGSGRLSELAPLRADVLAGDLRLFYLLWLTEVEVEGVEDGTPEPLPGLGPMTPALEAFAEFFCIDRDLVAAAAERRAVAAAAASSEDIWRLLANLNDAEKMDLLVRVVEGDVHVGAELRAALRSRAAPDTAALSARTASEIRAHADEIRLAREQAQAERKAAEERARAAAAEKARRTRLIALAQRGEAVWREVETEIERRNERGYDRAAELLTDLAVIAGEQGTTKDFRRRVENIRERHARKGNFIQRLAVLAP